MVNSESEGEITKKRNKVSLKEANN